LVVISTTFMSCHAMPCHVRLRKGAFLDVVAAWGLGACFPCFLVFLVSLVP
jgi:hypothetical protein